MVGSTFRRMTGAHAVVTGARHRVETTPAQRMAPQHATDRQPGSTDRSIGGRSEDVV